MGSNSDTRKLECGMPPVLGPLLFIIYSNNLPNCLNITKAILFADDTTVYIIHVHVYAVKKFIHSYLHYLRKCYNFEKHPILYNGLYSLPWKPILFGSNIFEIVFTDCYMLQGYTVFFCGILVIGFMISGQIKY